MSTPPPQAERPLHLGGCLCGAVRYRAFASPLWSALCHCRSCQKASGAPVMALFGMADPSWRWTAERPRWFASTPGVSRGFCGICGTAICHKSTRWLGVTRFHTATLDHPETMPPRGTLHADERIPWPDDLCRLPRWDLPPA